MTEPRRYGFHIDWGDVFCYLFVAASIAYATCAVMLAIGEGRL